MDTNKLKELAELASKATPGPWWIDSHGHCMVSESQDHRTVFLTNDGMGPATRHPETGNLSHWPNDWDASYIASADPTTILELIAEVERLRKHTEKAQCHALKMGTHALQGIEDAARLEGEVDRLKAENEALKDKLSDCAISLHGEMLQKYGGQDPEDMHPVTRRDYDRDMAEIAEYTAALEGGGR